jgi:hypothetical protein
MNKLLARQYRGTFVVGRERQVEVEGSASF